MTLALFLDDGLQVRRNGLPNVLVHRNPGYRDCHDGANQIVGDFVPADAGAASSARHRRVQHAALQAGVHVGKGHELRVGAHSVQQVAQHRAVAARLQSLKVRQGVQRPRREVVVALVIILHYHDAVGLLLNDAVQIRPGSVNDGEVGFRIGEQPPQVRHVNNWQVAPDVAGVNLRQLHRLVGNQPQRVRAGQTQLGERANLEHHAAVGAVFHPLDKAVNAVLFFRGVNQRAGVAGAVDADQLNPELRLRNHRGVSGTGIPGTAVGSRRVAASPAARGQGDYQRAEQGSQQILAHSDAGKHIGDSSVHIPSCSPFTVFPVARSNRAAVYGKHFKLSITASQAVLGRRYG